MTKKQKADRLLVEPKDEGVAVFSYDGIGLALRIGDKDIDTVFEVAKEAIKKQQQKSETDFKDESPKEKENGRQEEGEEVRTEGEERSSEATESVAGDTSTGGVSSEVHGPEKSDVR